MTVTKNQKLVNRRFVHWKVILSLILPLGEQRHPSVVLEIALLSAAITRYHATSRRLIIPRICSRIMLKAVCIHVRYVSCNLLLKESKEDCFTLSGL